MKIGERAARTGPTPSRIRFYERIGLLTSVERQANGYRRAHPENTASAGHAATDDTLSRPRPRAAI